MNHVKRSKIFCHGVGFRVFEAMRELESPVVAPPEQIPD